jgi:hypothetical protein
MSGEGFTTVRSLGGLLPPDLLRRVAQADRTLDGLRPDDYHLLPGETLRQAVSNAWPRVRRAWEAFRAAADRLAPEAAGTTETRERWLLPLFTELGYGRLPTARAIDAAGQSYPASHGYGRVPIHLVSHRVDLDTRTPGAAGAARWAPHAMVQELLNRSEDHLWGVVSNGLVLRLLRDNLAMTRQAYVEFDLRGMMDGESYADFVLLWLLCHQSRVEGDRSETCWLERWTETAQREGTRALDQLRAGVEKALATLGTGFLTHPANDRLRTDLRAGEVSPEDLYRQLLRLVYRLLFLFVAEDRDLLLWPEGQCKPDARDRYTRCYSTRRVRDLAARHVGTKHPDVWRGLHLVFRALGADEGAPELALPPLGGFLWGPDATADLDGCDLANRDLLEAVRALAFTVTDRVVRAVDYRNMGSEELGSVYEALLEQHPQVDVESRTFRLGAGAGSERKTTGSYYTPTSLITQLLDTALDPVLDGAAAAADPEAAILALKVIDPACGSGHFLVAAAHRIARRLAEVRTGESEPTPEATREALRDVVSRCLYGVDLNPMATELAKVSLWLEAHVPGKPLTFLDHHLKTGNSLLGVTPALIARGIPDEAFKPIEGDEKTVMASLRKRNRALREGQGTLFLAAEEGGVYNTLAAAAAELTASQDDTIEALHAKEERHRQLEAHAELQRRRLMADAWCGAFVAPKTKTTAGRQPFEAFYALRDGDPVPAPAAEETRRLAGEYEFFHWHLAYPDIFGERDLLQADDPTGWTGGFDVVLGNPPWEHTELKEKEFFAARAPEIAAAAGAKRKRLIAALAEDDPAMYEAFVTEVRKADGLSHLVRNSGRYPLCGQGRINTYAIFAETNRQLVGRKGRAGFIVPSGIATDNTTKDYFAALVDTASLVSLYDFENRKGIFAAVDSRMKFCLLTLAGAGVRLPAADFAFFALETADLADPERRFTLSPDDIALLNPNTRTCPIFRTRRDAEITKAIYRRVPVLVDENKPDGNPWGITFKQGLFNMTSDSHLFRTREELEADGWALTGNTFTRGPDRHLPLYEAKMIHHFDHRWATYTDAGDTRDLTLAEKQDSAFVVQPRYWVPAKEVDARLRDRWPHNWLLGFRRVARTTDERSAIFTVCPANGAGDSVFLMQSAMPPPDQAALLANLDSFAFDFVTRQKVGGMNFNFFIAQQLPALDPPRNSSCLWDQSDLLIRWVSARLSELIYSAWDLADFAADLGYAGPPFRWDPERRFVLSCELDAAFFHLYGIERDDVDYIMDTFPIVRRKDAAAHGEYRTKRVILEIYDAMTKAIDTGIPYQTLLDPPPAHDSLRHPPR